MKTTLRLLLAVCLAFLAASAAQAGDPSGSWKWKVTTPNGDTIDVSLTLELKEGKLTGNYSSRFGDAPITEASFKDEAVAFSVPREFDGNKFTIKYNGKLDGDSIKGSFELPAFGGGESVKMDWNATRAK
jgi:hypothetical protein